MTNGGNSSSFAASIEAALKILALVLGLAGYVQLVGGAVLWARFHEAGFPALRLVAEMPRDYVFVLGAAALVVPVAAGLVAAALQYAISPENPEGLRPSGFSFLLACLVVVAWVFVLEVLTIDGDWVRVVLALLAPVMAVVVARIAGDTTGFRYLTLLFFFFGALYGGLVAIAVEKSRDPRLDLAVAVRKGGESAVAGLLVARSDNSILIARTAALDPNKWQIVDLKPAEVEDFEFGPRGQPVTQASVREARSYAFLALRGQHEVLRCRGLSGTDLSRSLSAIARKQAIQVRVCVPRRGVIRVDALASGRARRTLGLGRDGVVATGRARATRPGVPTIVKASLTPQAMRRIARLRQATFTVEIKLTDRLDRIVRTRKKIRLGD